MNYSYSYQTVTICVILQVENFGFFRARAATRGFLGGMILGGSSSECHPKNRTYKVVVFH